MRAISSGERAALAVGLKPIPMLQGVLDLLRRGHLPMTRPWDAVYPPESLVRRTGSFPAHALSAADLARGALEIVERHERDEDELSPASVALAELARRIDAGELVESSPRVPLRDFAPGIVPWGPRCCPYCGNASVNHDGGCCANGGRPQGEPHPLRGWRKP